MTNTTSLLGDELRAQQRFLQRLAQDLVSDPSTADDLVQETWVRAAEAGIPTAKHQRRPWLATVLRRIAINRQISDRRRRSHESDFARTRSTDDSDSDIAARLQREEAVITAVRRLREPYRKTIYFRYYRGLTPSEIANLERIPLTTVKSRLSRARAQLRASLDREFGHRRAWIVALTPFGATPPSTAIAGALLMSSQTKSLAVAITALAALAFWFINDTEQSPEQSPSAPPTALAATPSANKDEVDAAETAANNRVAVEHADDSSNDAAINDIPEQPIIGHTLGTDGSRLAGVRIRYGSKAITTDPVTHSDDEGAIRFARTDAAGTLQVEDDAWVGLIRVRVREFEDEPPAILIAAPRTTREGCLVDPAGNPVGGIASLELHPPSSFRFSQTGVLDNAITESWRTTTQHDGKFRFDAAPAMAGTTLVVEHERFKPRTLQLPKDSSEPLVITLQPLTGSADALHGVVLGPSGQPIEDARVSLGAQVVHTSVDGAFCLDLEVSTPRRGIARPTDDPLNVLCAVKAGYLPAQLLADSTKTEGTRAWPDGIVLRLGAEPLSIRGRVVDQRGHGLQGRMVWIQNLTWFSRENGGQVLENMLAGKPRNRWIHFTSGSDGAFEIPGLLKQDYTVVAADPDSTLQVHSKPIAAGSTGVVLTLDRRETWSRISGKVLTAAGEPVGDTEVMVLFDAGHMFYGDQRVRHTSRNGAKARTAEDGSYVLENVPKQHVYLGVHGFEVLWHRFFQSEPIGSSHVDELRDIDLVVQVRAHLRLEMRDPDEADEFAVLGPDGETLTMMVFEGKPRSIGQRGVLVDGRSQVTSVPSTGATLVLLKDDTEVRRVPITLTRGHVTVL